MRRAHPPTPWPLAAFLVATLVVTGLAQEETPDPDRGSYKRSEVPGHYTVGLYGDEFGTARHVELAEDQTTFQAWIGLTGDEFKDFSAVVFRLDLDFEVEMDGPIRWYPIPGLVHWNNVLEQGVQVEFNKECQRQEGDRPVILGRMTFKVPTELTEGEIRVEPHRDYKLSVELCDYNMWYKPYAHPLNLTFERKLSFWTRLQKLFG